MSGLRNQRGSALLVALGFMVLVLVIAAGVHGLVIGELRNSGSLQQRVAAEYLADGGVAHAIAWFNAQGYQIPTDKTLAGTVPVTLVSDNKPVVLPSHHPDSYVDAFGQQRTGMVTSYNQYLTAQSGPVGTYSVTASLIARAPETWEVVATGQSGVVQRQVGVLLTRDQTPLFTDALFGRDQVAMSGNATTDSYDSSLGGYGGSNKFKTGNVHSNGAINLSGNATIQGDAIPGPNSTVSTNGNAGVTGATDPATNSKTLPPPTVPAGAIDLGALSLSGNSTRTITAGIYQVSSLSISGNGNLVIDASGGPVTFYVTGSVSIAGNGISNGSGLPTNLSIIQTGSSGVSFAGNSNFSGTIYAPNSQLSLSGNGALFGGFIGSSVAISGNGSYHYDQVLRTIPGTSGSLRLVAQWTNP